jgi:hypothetical protein
VLALRLNVLPAALEGPPSDAAYYVPHDDDLFKSLRELERSTGSFHCFRLSDRIYIWPKRGGAIPSTVDLSRAGTITASDIPPRALAHAVREAATDFMVSEPHGFERLRGRTFDPVRLFRRRRNLASGAGVQLADEAGVYSERARQAGVRNVSAGCAWASRLSSSAHLSIASSAGGSGGMGGSLR